MCDEGTLRDANRFVARAGGLTRREFGTGVAGAGLAALLPGEAAARGASEQRVQVPTPDGTADCFFVHPRAGKHPGVILWPDILGLRPAFEGMGRRLALAGYAVLVVNPYYRERKAPVVEKGATFRDEATRNEVLSLARTLSETTHTTDGRAFVDFLDGQSIVDTNRKIGTLGYCMGGPIVMRTAAAVPERIGAGASFHGGRLVTDRPDSPHRLIPKLRASFLFAIAENDDEKQPEAKDVLRRGFAAAGRSAEIEVYEGALHGWCPPDSPVYNEAQAERAWSRLLALFESALA